ncbi:M23 family metallopeptidase [Candidatus Neomarinimicrobiota bacterium]
MTTGNNTCEQPVGAIITDNIVIFQCDKEVQLIMGDGIWSTGAVDGKNIEFSNIEYHTDDGCESTHDMAVQLEGTSDNLTGMLTTNVSFDATSCGDQSNCMVETEIKLEIISHYLESCLGRDDFGNPSSSEYILPYPLGKSYKNNNSYCLPTGHREQQAYDFLIPIGETIIASRGGTVRQIKESSPDNGQGSDHNHIMIEHQDGTVGFYAHLKNNGVLVNVGDTVETGDIIALAGHSGTTDVEHLHFGVYNSYPPQEGNDRAINFKNTDGPTDCNGGLVNGAFYTAL